MPGTKSPIPKRKLEVESTSSADSRKMTKIASKKLMGGHSKNSRKFGKWLERLERDGDLKFSKELQKSDMGTVMFDHKGKSTSIPFTPVRRMMTLFGPDFSLWDSEMKDALESEHGPINKFADNLDSFADYLGIGLDLLRTTGLDKAKVEIKKTTTDDDAADEDITIKQNTMKQDTVDDTLDDTQASCEETAIGSGSNHLDSCFHDTESDSDGEMDTTGGVSV